MLPRGPVAIIGAGISGLSCAQALRFAGVEAHLFEKTGRVGGRCATTLWQGHLVDYGFQYFTAETLDFKRELLVSLRQFRPIVPPILDEAENVVQPPHGSRFYVLQGNNYFAHVLSRDLDVRLQAEVETLAAKNEGIECRGHTYRAVVSSLPAPQTAHLFEKSQPPPANLHSLSVVLEYNHQDTGDSEDCYGRVLPSGAEPLSASYCENHKAGRVLNNRTVFVLQVAPAFSRAHAGLPSESYLPELAAAHEDLWKIPAGKRSASFVHSWRFSAPAPPPSLPPGTFLCGDFPADTPIEGTWLAGRKAAAQVLAYLAS
jgi:renalase